MSETLVAALRYAALGIHVFPCNDQNRPLTPHGFKDATTNPTQIKIWFDDPSPPRLAIATGTISGLVVLDLDVKHGVDGHDTLDRLEAEHDPLPATRSAQTQSQSGGTHYYWRCTTSIPCSVAKLGPGLDVRGDGGYVVAPPSPGYFWDGDDVMVDAPGWLLELMAPTSTEKGDSKSTRVEPEPERAAAALATLTYTEEMGRDWWLHLGMSFKAAGGRFVEWDLWCQNQPGYEGRDRLAVEWVSWKGPEDITDRDRGPGTLYARAKEAGWREGPTGRVGKPGIDGATIGLEAKLSAKGEFRGYLPTLTNAVRLFAARGGLTFNEAEELALDSGEPMTDATIGELRTWAHGAVPWTGELSKAHAYDAASIVARRNGFNPIVERLESLTWDGVERLSYWLDDICGIPRTEYTMAVARAWLISAVARAMEPGCKVDTLPVLVGAQGSLKSTLLHELYYGWHTDTPIRVEKGADAYQVIRMCWCYEFSELASWRGPAMETLKAFISSQVDVYRDPYGRITQRWPRRCVFVGSSNDTSLMNDPSGARRIWTLIIGEISLEPLCANRDQMWAEAVTAYKAGEQWHLDGMAEEEAAAVAENNYVADPWEEKIAAYVEGMETVSPTMIYNLLELEIGRMNQGDSHRVTRIMVTRLGFKRQTIRLHPGAKPTKGFRRT